MRINWRLARYIYIVCIITFLLPAFFAVINKDKGLYVIGVKYHNELLSVGYCRAEDRENITYLSNSIKQALLSNSSMNIINKANQGIMRAYNGSCFFNTVTFAPALENVTYNKLIAVKNTIIIYAKPYGTANTSRKDLLVIKVGNNIVNLYMIALMFPFTMSLKELVKRFTDRERQPEISHYLLLIGLSYTSLSLFIQFMIWLSSGFQVTALEILMLLCSFTLILVISTPQIILCISRLLCQISRYLCPETTESKEYTLLMGAFLFSIIFLAVPLAFLPPFLENIRISSTVAIGISVIFTIMLMLLNINNINAITASYQIMLTMMTFHINY